MVWPAIISAAATIGGGLLAKKGQGDANDANRDIAAENRVWQERMSNTAYQRSMADMREAGLNPILAYKTGGASTPSGTTATMQNELGAMGDSIAGAASSALNARQQQAELENLNEVNKKIVQDTKVAEATEKNLFWDSQKKQSETFATDQQAANARIQAEILKKQDEIYGSQIVSARAAAAGDRATEDFFNTDIGQIVRKADIIGKALNPFASSAKSLKGK